MPSSAPPTHESDLRLRGAPAEMVLTDWPLRDRPLPSSVALTLAAGASWLAAWFTQNPIVGLLMALALALTLWRTWLPVQYELNISGITQSVLGLERRIAWTAIRTHQVRDDGVLLLPDESATALSPLRGLYLHWGGRRDEVLAQLNYYLHAQHSEARTGSHPPAGAGNAN